MAGKPDQPASSSTSTSKALNKPSRTLGHAFPCIYYGSGEDDTSGRSISPVESDNQLADALEGLDLAHVELVGSAPTGLEGLTVDGKRLVGDHPGAGALAIIT